MNFRQWLAREESGYHTGGLMAMQHKGYDQNLQEPEGLAYRKPVIPKKKSWMSKQLDKLFGKKDEAQMSPEDEEIRQQAINWWANYEEEEEEEEEDWWVLHICGAEANTPGYHGTALSGEDRPAGDCFKAVKWDLPFLSWPREIERLLQEAKATVRPQDASWFSYHECRIFLYIEVYIRDEAVAKQIAALIGGEPEEHIWKATPNDSPTYGLQFPFTNFKDAVTKSLKAVKHLSKLSPPKELGADQVKATRPYKPKTGESREGYWQRIMQAADLKAKMKQRRDPMTREGD
jgi:hypothetical protein